jgi:hypothetical protein
LIIIQDEDDIEAAEIYVYGTIEEHKYKFLLDTGAAKTTVYSDDFTSRFNSLGKRSSSGLFAKQTADLITVPSIKLGPISKRDFTLARKTPGNTAVRNLIGMDLLKDYNCKFLFDEDRVLVSTENDSEGDYAVHELYFDKASHPYVGINFGELKATAVWDTGAGITVADTSFIHRHPMFFEEVGQSEGTDSTGAKAKTPMYMMAETIIGGFEFPPHKIAGVDLSHINSGTNIRMDLVLGYSTISKANWLFNFPCKKWAILNMLT